MSYQFIPKIDLKADITETKLNTESPNASFRMNSMTNSTNGTDFKSVMMDLANNLNATVKAPDQVMQDAMLGNGADVHDVMIAMSKAEIGMSIATSATTKVLQAYDKITAIQV